MKKQEIKNYFRLFLKKLLRMSIRCAFFIPVKKNKILFFAGMKGYTCNPKYVCEYINDHVPGKYELCWIGKNEREISDISYLKFVKFSPLSLFWALTTCKIFVTSGENAILPKSRKRLIICTWHGTAYKKVGFDTKDKWAIIDTSNSAIDIILSVSEEYTEHLIQSGFRYNGKILNSGYPRNDIFFDKIRYDAAAKKVREHYNIDKKIVLFAPTYRGDYQTANKVDFKIDFDRLKKTLVKKFGNNVELMIRMHYFDKNFYDFPSDIVDAGDWPDMQELLCAADILITDYSSTIWDFSLTKKPCLLYLPDLKEYAETRGLYTAPETWPGILCKNMDELCDSVSVLDEKYCSQKAEQYLNSVGSYENGSASEKVFTEIINFLKRSY